MSRTVASQVQQVSPAPRQAVVRKGTGMSSPQPLYTDRQVPWQMGEEELGHTHGPKKDAGSRLTQRGLLRAEEPLTFLHL